MRPNEEREKRLLEEEAEINWIPMTLPGGLVIEVTNDALKWRGVRYGVSCYLQQQLADKYKAYLPTVLISDQCADQADVLMPIRTQNPDHTMDDDNVMEAQSAYYDEVLQKFYEENGIYSNETILVAGWKDWILHPLMGQGKAVNYGWHAKKSVWPSRHAVTKPAMRIVQPAANAHTLYHSDYSQMCRLWRPVRCPGFDEDLFFQEHSKELGLHTVRRHPDVPKYRVTPKVPRPSNPKPALPDPQDTTPKRTKFGQNDKHLHGTPVRDWQEHLNEMGFGPLAEDGIHGTLTERASKAYEASKKEPDHDDVEAQKERDERLSIEWLDEPRKMLDYDITFVQSRSFTRGRPDYARCRGVVIHTAEIDEVSTAAERLRDWTASGRAGVSWHFAVDNDSITQSVLEMDTAWACGPANDEFIHIELAGRANQSDAQWDDEYSKQVLARAASLVADICADYLIPVAHIKADDLLSGEIGITGHDEVSRASMQARSEGLRELPWWDAKRRVPRRTTNHYDPGPNFPWEHFLDLVRNV